MAAVQGYLMELVCSTRWFCNFLLTSDVEGVNHQRYPRDVESAKQTLFTLSKTHSHVEDIAEIPEGVVATLCEGTLYLLVAEAILGHAPPTMHQFLQQTTLQREQSAVQAHLLLLRWLLTAEIIQIDEMVDMIFDNAAELEDFASDYDAHMAIARHLAQPDPFFLGAHVLIARGLLLHHCNATLYAQDVLDHLKMILPPDAPPSPELHTIEDLLLLWIRSVVGLFSADLSSTAAKVLASEIKHVDDLYLHTNDGRVLALVLHHYQPSALDIGLIHLSTPLTVWQRQDNWTCIIRAAESLGVWVGMFADEMVAHGFLTLQLHVLRLVQDLFLVLAGGAEQNYEALRGALVDAHSATGNLDSPHDIDMSGNTSAGMELEGETLFIDKNVMHSMMGAPAGTTKTPHVADASVDRQSSATDADSPTTTPRTGSHAQCRATRNENDGVVDDGTPDVSQQHEDYNFVMTGLFLQGMSIPIRRQEEVSPALNPVANSVVAEPPPSPEVLVATASPPAAITNSATLSIQAPSSNLDGRTAEEPPRSDSPVLVGRSAELRRQKRQIGAVASSVAHFEQVRTNRANTATATKDKVRHSTMVVQGSLDAEGIEQLLQELSTVGQDPRGLLGVRAAGGGEAPSVADLRDVRAQNQQLRWALEEQQRKVQAIVERLRSGIRKHEFDAIVKHLKMHSKPPNPPVSTALGGITQGEAVRRSQLCSGAALPNISFAGTSTAAGTQVRDDAAAMQRVEHAFRASLDNFKHVGSSGSRPSKCVVSGVGTKAAPSSNGRMDDGDLVPSSVGNDVHRNVPVVKKAAKGGLVLQFSTGSLQGAKAAAATAAPPPPTVQLTALPKLRSDRSSGSTTTKQRHHSVVEDDGCASLGSTLGGAASSTVSGTSGSMPTPAPVHIKVKSNKSVMVLAFKHVLLTGQLNKPALEKVLSILHGYPEDGGHQFIVLFKDEFTQQFRGLYTVRTDGMVVRVYGCGPHTAYAGPQPTSESEVAMWTQGQPYLFPKFFKFDSGSKTFQLFPAKFVNQAADGVAFAAAKPKMVDRERF